MAFGIYVHIPYCVQRCSYCDFATYEQDRILPPEQYVDILLREIRQRHAVISQKRVDTLYFGGGTPSLISSQLIEKIINELRLCGFVFTPEAEITIEINPATINDEKLAHYLSLGMNRFSVGAQTFHSHLLKIANRIHSEQDTIHTLELLNKHRLNFSFDLLFALPTQTLAEVESDVITALKYATNHLSAYCLTVPEGHPMSKGRAPEAEQVEMFTIIESALKKKQILRYEISNFAKPGFESKHNLLYWSDQPYWGVGLGAHSYLKDRPWGERFWNPNNIDEYVNQIKRLPDLPAKAVAESFHRDQFEHLEKHQSLTDYCHIFLRVLRGINTRALQEKFGDRAASTAITRLEKMQREGLLNATTAGFCLSQNGLLLSNLVFERMTFSADEISG